MRGANLLRDAISTSSMAPQDKRLFGSINRQILGGQPGDRLGPVGRVDRTADFDLSASHSRLRDPRPPRVRAPLPAADAPAPRSFGLDRERRAAGSIGGGLNCVPPGATTRRRGGGHPLPQSWSLPPILSLLLYKT